ncbi:hypothetical protein IQE94_02365 [Synechocystis sp. PCC 7339]|uniref:hypothetical protein n=1 Tax=unclassified Synechocystis TaxID=2640012 RepID=UPI001BAF1C45|nr:MULTISPECIES: hypothetical protein [unclassified Synechocystis]QUS61021.1 hypothetical protein HTZ78_10315 [Synechocystis sp. PCC 7338]UAJ73205.1 hypothetical protein IQE94_02365 [Synechocystis sp. PCC 7339]
MEPLPAICLAIAGLSNELLRDFDEGYYVTPAQDTYPWWDWRYLTISDSDPDKTF